MEGNNKNAEEMEITTENVSLQEDPKDDQSLIPAVSFDINRQINEVEEDQILIQTLKAKMELAKVVSKYNEENLKVLKLKNEKLREELDVVLFDYPQVQRSINNTFTMVRTMGAHCDKLQKDISSVTLKTFQSDLETNVSDYKSKKEMLLDRISGKITEKATLKAELEQSEKDFLVSKQSYESENHSLQNTASSLRNELKHLQEECTKLESEIVENLTLYKEKESAEILLLQDIESIDLNKIENEKMSAAQNHFQIIAKLKKDTAETKEVAENLQLQKKEIEEKDENEIHLAIEYDKELQSLENVLGSLKEENSAIENELRKTKEENAVSSKEIQIKCNEYKLDIQEMDKDIYQNIQKDAELCKKINELETNYFNLINSTRISQIELNVLTQKLEDKTNLLLENKKDSVDLTNNLDDLSIKKNDLKNQFTMFKNSFEQLQSTSNMELESIKKETDVLKVHYDNLLCTMKQDHERQVQNLKTNLNSAKEDNASYLKNLKNEIEVSIVNLKEIESRRKNKQRRTKSMEILCNSLTAKKNKLINENDATTKSESTLKIPGILKQHKSGFKRVSFQHNLKWESSESSLEEPTNSNMVKDADELWKELSQSKVD